MSNSEQPQEDNIPDSAEELGSNEENVVNIKTPADDQNDRVAQLEERLKETSDRLLRALAEADNTRKRLEKERQDTAKYAVSSFARDLLSVADNMRRALAAITPEQREQNAEFKNIAIGVEATERELLNLFERNGIRRIDPMGQMFDPNLHDVMFESDATGQPAGTIIQVLEPGYTIHDRLLRPARVGVAKASGEPQSDAGNHIDTSA